MYSGDKSHVMCKIVVHTRQVLGVSNFKCQSLFSLVGQDTCQAKLPGELGKVLGTSGIFLVAFNVIS